MEDPAAAGGGAVEHVEWEGARVRGRVEGSRDRWVAFDPRRLRMVKPYRGTRLSVVFFSVSEAAAASPEDLIELRRLGFKPHREDPRAQDLGRTDLMHQKLDEKASRLHAMGYGSAQTLRTLLEYSRCDVDRLFGEFVL